MDEGGGGVKKSEKRVDVHCTSPLILTGPAILLVYCLMNKAKNSCLLQDRNPPSKVEEGEYLMLLQSLTAAFFLS